MNHGTGSGWKMWIPMILCCTAMIGAVALVGVGVLSFS